jgi:hypothetical protein
MKKVIGFLFSLAVVAALSTPARADGWGVGKVSAIYVQANGDIGVYLDDFNANCGGGGYIVLNTSYLSATTVEYYRDLFLAARLSGRRVELSTTGCIGGAGKVTNAGITWPGF